MPGCVPLQVVHHELAQALLLQHTPSMQARPFAQSSYVSHAWPGVPA
jgi:hypothetical protein